MCLLSQGTAKIVSLHLASALPQALGGFSRLFLSGPVFQGRHDVAKEQEEQQSPSGVSQILPEVSAHETQSWFLGTHGKHRLASVDKTSSREGRICVLSLVVIN